MGDKTTEHKIVDNGLKPREKWNRRFDFLLACIGGSVGLGNVWRFPYLCYKNGGGAFLVAYFICVVVGGIPMFFLEVSLGQFMATGSIGAWRNLCPLFQGVGYACTIMVFFRNIYYNVILAWIFYYLFASFTSVLPWSHCDNDWNTPYCRVIDKNQHNVSEITYNISSSNQTANYGMLANVSVLLNNGSETNSTSIVQTDPVTEYWQHKVLGLSSGIDDSGIVKWDLALCLLLAWIVVYFCICKGIRSSGKVMYVTATLPYLLLFILLIRGVTLPGAWEGVKFYVLPNWEKLKETQVWIDAGTQIFFSSSICMACLTALGSFNEFHQNCWRDSLVYSAVNSGTSILAGFVIFPVLGFMAQEQGLSVADVAESGPGLAFIAYPQALSQMPVAPLWSVVFFITLFLLGIDSQFTGVEGLVTAIVDDFAHYLRRGYRKEIFIGIMCIIMYLFGLPMITNGGIYVFQLFDYYLGSRILLVVAFFECIVVAYVYGVKRFHANLTFMLGFNIGPLMKICWGGVTPAFTLILLGLCIWYTQPLTYNRIYEYPWWSEIVGWSLGLSGVLMIPLMATYTLIRSKGNLKQRFRQSIHPILQKHQIGETEDFDEIVQDDQKLKQNGHNLDYLETVKLKSLTDLS